MRQYQYDIQPRNTDFEISRWHISARSTILSASSTLTWLLVSSVGSAPDYSQLLRVVLPSGLPTQVVPSMATENKSGFSKEPRSLLITHTDFVRIVGALFIIGWNIVWTSLIMCFIKYVCRVPLRMSEEQLLAGDDMIHGEAAYVLGPCEAHEHLMAGNYVKRRDTGVGELGMGGVTVGQDPHAQNDVHNELQHEKATASGSHEVKDG